MRAEQLLMIVLLGGITIGCTLVLSPFFSAILWAAILTYTTWPMYEWLRGKLRLGHATGAAVMVLVVAVVVVLPLALAAPGGAGDVDQISRELQAAIARGLPGAPDWVAKVPVVGASLSNLWNTFADDLGSIVPFLKPYLGVAGGIFLRVLLGLVNGVLLFLLALFVAFFFFASGEPLAAHFVAVLRRIAGERADRLIEVTGSTIRGVVYGILGTAVMQGILTGLGLWAVGVPRPLILGVIAGSMSILPIGAPTVWIPSALWLFSGGHTIPGLILLAYGAIGISGADSVIRPYFISRGAHLPFLLTMLGVLGGALAFGLLGVFVGPVLLGVGYTLVLEYGAPARTALGREEPLPIIGRSPGGA